MDNKHIDIICQISGIQPYDGWTQEEGNILVEQAQQVIRLIFQVTGSLPVAGDLLDVEDVILDVQTRTFTHSRIDEKHRLALRVFFELVSNNE